MAKARAIVKRRKAVRNIRKITKTMQMIATAKFQKSLKRAVGTKPYTRKVRELVSELAASVGNVQHPLLRRPGPDDQTNRIALIVITSNRGLAGAYNGSVLRAANHFIRQQEAAGKSIDLYVAGKKGIGHYNYQKRPIVQKYDIADQPKYVEVEQAAEYFIQQFTSGQVDSVHIAYMNFISTGTQKAEVLTLMPLAGVKQAADHLGQQAAERDAAHASVANRSAADVAKLAEHESKGRAKEIRAEEHTYNIQTTYDFSPSAKELLDELLPLTVKAAMFQCFMDAVTSENIARMVAMKSATDNADKIVKSLTMKYNRARQSQITTELSEIMGGVEAMKS